MDRDPLKWMESARVEIGSMIIEKSFEIDGISKSRDLEPASERE